MAKRSASDIFLDLLDAGFSAASATIMTAIALAESGGDPAAVGDVALQDNTWGPSFGLYQIRTLKHSTGSGVARDITALVDPEFQAQAAYSISGSGTNFTPWSVYTSGAYQAYLGQAQQAADQITTFATGPFGLPGLGGSSTVEEVLAGGRAIAVEAAFVGLGLVLIVAGAARAWLTSPPARHVRAQSAAAVKAVL